MSSQHWSVYDRADLLDAVSSLRGDHRREILIGLDGMHCAACTARVQRLLADSVTELGINLSARVIELVWDPQRTVLSTVLSKLDEAGFQPRVLAQDQGLQAEASERRAALTRLGVAIIGSMQVMMLAWPSYFSDATTDPAMQLMFRWAQWALATPVVLYSGWPFFRNAWQALSTRMLNMDVPVALALLIAYGASAWRTLAGSGEIYFDTATMFVLLLAAGRFLEGRTRALATARLRLLVGRQALTVRRVRGASIEELPVTALVAGDRLQIMPGEALPADGLLVNGPAELDESLLTGESRPVLREAGASVLAGSVNLSTQPLLVDANGVGSRTLLSQITRLLNHAQSERPRFQILADRLAGHFILAVLVLALIGAWLASARGADAAMSVTLAVLVASCPCALSLAVPAALAAASTHLASHGVLIARPEALARLSEVDTAIFDKTGTLTRSEFTIQTVSVVGPETETHYRQLAAALEAGSLHPIARAFASTETPFNVEQLRHEPARGVSGQICGHPYWLGAPEYAPVPVAALAADLQQPSHTPLSWIVLTSDDRPLAFFGLSAPIRAEAASVLAALHKLSLNVQLLSGDSPEATAPLAQALNIQHFAARQTPEDKLAQLRRVQAEGRVVMAVGDGINDAPLLAAADVAVAMPQGAALAQARADVILIGDSLSPLPKLFAVAHKTRRLIRQNIAWALAYNLAVLPLAMSGWLAPWMAALGMSASSLLVVGNALRVAHQPQATPPKSLGQPAAQVS